MICNYGKKKDLSDQLEIISGVTQLIQNASENKDQIKIHAAKCYGGIASCNIEKFLPNIIDLINQKKEGYLMLYTLKEALQNTTVVSTQILQIEKFLFEQSTSEEESVRNIVAECIGKPR